MLKLLGFVAFAALIAACAAPVATSASDPMHDSRGSTATGASKAAGLGFHGPVDRSTEVDGPN